MKEKGENLMDYVLLFTKKFQQQHLLRQKEKRGNLRDVSHAVLKFRFKRQKESNVKWRISV